jgi:hypothetical protein
MAVALTAGSSRMNSRPTGIEELALSLRKHEAEENAPAMEPGSRREPRGAVSTGTGKRLPAGLARRAAPGI